MAEEGRAVLAATCWVHGGPFTCDPATVCTVYIGRDGHVQPPGTDGARQVEICDPCMEVVNRRRAAAGKAPFRLSREMPGSWEAEHPDRREPDQHGEDETS